MPATEQIPDDLPVARAAIGSDETATDAILRAAERAHVDLDHPSPRLHDQIDADALDALVSHHRSQEGPNDFVFVSKIWDRTFVLTPDSVEVYP
ncbi:HalOD1 output domain-containing protein [Halosimplex sp. J119]